MAALSFVAPSRKGDNWVFAGLMSSFPESGDEAALHEPRACGNDRPAPGCKVFSVPREDSSQAQQVEGDEMVLHDGAALRDQVLVFRYRGKFHAIDNKCPHSAFPLAKGTPFDIEDFGVVLSAGIHCPKHGWSFDLHTGNADRGNYVLRRWEVELRPIPVLEMGNDANDKQPEEGRDQEIWLRRKQRIG